MKPAWVGVLGFGMAALLAGLLLQARVAPPDRLKPQPPVEVAGAGEWLDRRKPLSDRPVLGSPDWALLADARDLAVAWRHALEPRALQPAAVVGVTAHRWAPPMLREAATATRLDPELVALLLDPPWGAVVADRCPAVPRRLRALCGQRGAAEAAVDAWLAGALASADPDTTLALLGAFPDLGDRGAAVARGVLADGAPSARPRAVVALSWAAGSASIPDLRALLAEPGPLVPLVAALELGRLGAADADADLAALQARLAGTGDAVLVAYARQLATGTLPVDQPLPGL